MCLRPIFVKVTSRTFGNTRYFDAPCGHCIECLKRKQNDWKNRIRLESEYWNNLYFFTLTYSNDSLPCRLDYRDEFGEPLFTGTFNECKDVLDVLPFPEDLIIRSTACKKEIQNWFKAMREDISRSLGHRWDCKYFICSEYGPNPNGTKRPHYHGVIMCNEDYNTLVKYFNDWHNTKGRSELKQVGLGRQEKSKVANYISKYCAKGCFESRQEDISLGLIERTWYIMSKGISERWLSEHSNQWLKYVPKALSIKGDWTPEDVERFFICSDDSLSVRNEIENLLDNYFLYDGETHKYKLPRYFVQRLFQVKKTFINYECTNIPNLRICESKLQSPSMACQCSSSTPLAFSYVSPPITYVTRLRKDSRYVSENFLSVAIAYCLYMRFVNSERRRFEAFCENNKDLSLPDISREYAIYKDNAMFYREQLSTQSLRDFYESNMWKHREFDFLDDSGQLIYTNFHF